MTGSNDNSQPRWGVILAYSDLMTSALLNGEPIEAALARAKFLPDSYTADEARLIQMLVNSNISLAVGGTQTVHER